MCVCARTNMFKLSRNRLRQRDMFRKFRIVFRAQSLLCILF